MATLYNRRLYLLVAGARHATHAGWPDQHAQRVRQRV